MGKHKIINGKLLNMDKRFSDLKEKQKNFIRELLFKKYKELFNRNLSKKEINTEVLNYVYYQIQEKEIWLPFGELKKEFQRRKIKMQKRILGC